MITRVKLLSILAIFGFLFAACDEEETLQPLNINFENTEAAIGGSASTANVNIIFSRASEAAGTLTLQINAGSLTYGEANDFYTEPAAANNEIELAYDAGADQLSFQVYAGEGLNIQSDETISFQLMTDMNSQLAVGANNAIDILFTENFIAQSGSLSLSAGGPEFPNQAFVDLSKLSESSVDKFKWDLGFSAEGEFRVIVNPHAQVMARALDVVSLDSVTAEDTINFASEMQIGFAAQPMASAWIDDPSGDLTKTTIAEISADANENKVYIIRRNGEGENWKKVKINRDGEAYSIRYADISSNDIQTVTVERSATHSFTHFDFEEGEVDFAPPKEAWDFTYGTFTELFPFGPNTIPYEFKDYIIINRVNTSVAMVMTTKTESYEGFTLADVESVEFDDAINALGSDWRQGGGPGSAPALYEDRFFVIRDNQENVYKLQFTSMYAFEGTERGAIDFRFEKL